ncbi:MULTISPECIES: GNAT family N-acetyltransferase [unclassified Fusibacter]|uniref:GNAT family N-acetyltransferase n=1 Tax=unclassified Fusibacter TaxID=2624464 RepID=UPI0010126747|nr:MULTISPECIES: GNAT family N-acetyltransferase [unclassified Fusibacter]MCK8058205.1 GNAT family N-acetyltransferase [Fusibacter sp. A2]NPE20788.1 GNAT family N-acetyltransferase [Fusibacter sp. A1]RXV62994.1 GNAT family N-acetyltransferase [Fusibacter sp. A1]
MLRAIDETRANVARLFERENSTILKSYLEGHMGEAWVDRLDNPTAAQVRVDIFTFYAGDVNSPSSQEMIRNLGEHNLIVTKQEDWKREIEKIHLEAAKFPRYSFHQDPSVLDQEKLRCFIKELPKEYEIRPIDRTVLNDPQLERVMIQVIQCFDSVDDYLKRGFGYCIYKGDVLVSAALPFSIYNKGVEIDIATHEDYRGKGLATVTAAVMMLECLKRGLYPNWDAANETSYKLALKLRYEFDEAYDTYYVNVGSDNE